MRLRALAVVLLTGAGCSLVTNFDELAARDGAGGGTAAETSSSSATSVSSSGTGEGGAAGAGGAGDALCAPGELAPCYSGAPSTLDVGVCHVGEQTCNVEGTAFGPCEGEVSPSPENCAAPADEDCDGAAQACTGAVNWAKRFGGVGDQRGARVAADASGNLLVAGVFSGSINFGGQTLTSVGGDDLFVAKLDPSGGHVWSRRFGGAGDEAVGGLASSPGGDVVLAGTYLGAVDFGLGPLSSNGGSEDIFVMVLEGADGATTAAESFGGSAADHVDSVAIGPNGEIALTGSLEGSADFGGGPLPHAGGQDLFVAMLDPGGAHLWSKTFGGASTEHGTGIAVDADGHALVTGFIYGTADFGLGPLISAGGADVIALELDAGGATVWAQRFGDGGDQFPKSIAAGGAGAVLIAGFMEGSFAFGAAQLTSAGLTDAFVLELDGAGGPVWGKRFGDADAQYATTIAVDPWDNVLVTGLFYGAIGFGGAPLTAAGLSDGYVAKLDPGGAEVWARAFGDAADQSGQAVASDPFGAALLTGWIAGSAQLDAVSLTSAGGADAVVAKIAP